MKKRLSILAGTALAASLSFPLLAQTTGTLTFTFTEAPHSTASTYNGNAQHVLAVWIQNTTGTGTGTFVKTKLRYVGNGTKDHLPTWAVNSGGTASNATSTACNKTDATTGATLSSWTTKTITWDGKNVSGTSNGTTVADGSYKVTIQSTWDHGTAGTVTKSYTFTKGPTADLQTPANDVNFTGITLNWVPTATGVESISLNPEINVYPNPTNGIFNVDFNKANNIKVVNILGSVVYDEKIDQAAAGTKNIDLTNFANGIYMINVSNDEGSSTYKVILNK